MKKWVQKNYWQMFLNLVLANLHYEFILEYSVTVLIMYKHIMHYKWLISFKTRVYLQVNFFGKKIILILWLCLQLKK